METGIWNLTVMEPLWFIRGAMSKSAVLKINLCLELTAMKHRGSARKGKEEFALSGLSKLLLAAVQVGR
jgi:hypothetical protein